MTIVLIVPVLVAGNVLVIYVIMSHAFMRSHVHVLLINLALADVAFLVCCVPFQAQSYADVDWVFGDVMCKVTHYVIYVTLYVTVWTLVSIAVLRCYVVVWSQQRLQHSYTRHVVVYTVLLWVVMVQLSLPYGLAHQQQVSGLYTYCDVAPRHERAVAMALFLSAYLLPLLLLLLAYAAVMRSLLRLERGTRRRRRDMHVTRGIITVVACFLLAWLPYHVLSLVSAYGGGGGGGGMSQQLMRIASHTLAFSNSVVNPFIYNYVCRDFRHAFKHLLRCRDANCALSNKRSNTRGLFRMTNPTPREQLY